MSVKTKEDYIKLCKMLGEELTKEKLLFLDQGGPLNQPLKRGKGLVNNLEILIQYSLTKLERYDLNLESESAQQDLSKFLAKTILQTAEGKNWWDKYYYDL